MCKYANVQICKCANMQMCKYANVPDSYLVKIITNLNLIRWKFVTDS